MTETAYSTDNPETVAAVRTRGEAWQRDARRAGDDAEALGKNKGPLIVKSPFGTTRLVGLAPDDPADPPPGWRYLKSTKQLEPVRAKAGDVARAWLDDHQPTSDLRTVLEQHGLPRTSRYDRGGQYHIGTPMVVEHGDTVWAKYSGKPDGECTWTPRKLSEFHAALEASQAAEAVTADV
jgi:hypothetical protein